MKELFKRFGDWFDRWKETIFLTFSITHLVYPIPVSLFDTVFHGQDIKIETEMTIICPYCGKNFDVALEVKNEYTGITIVLCPFCNKYFEYNGI